MTNDHKCWGLTNLCEQFLKFPVTRYILAQQNAISLFYLCIYVFIYFVCLSYCVEYTVWGYNTDINNQTLTVISLSCEALQNEIYFSQSVHFIKKKKSPGIAIYLVNVCGSLC